RTGIQDRGHRGDGGGRSPRPNEELTAGQIPFVTLRVPPRLSRRENPDRRFNPCRPVSTIASPRYARDAGYNPFELVPPGSSRTCLSVVRTGSCPGSPAAEPGAARLSSVPLHRADRGERGVAVPDVAAEPILLVEDLGPVRRLTMNRPDALNALDTELTEAISVAIRAAGADETVSVVILRGAGRAFCAGYDLNEDATGGALDANHWFDELHASTAKMLEIFDCPKPVIASVQSYCLAGGTDLMLACDLAVAAHDAYFGYVDVRFGSGVVSMFLRWVVGMRAAKELLFTGEDRVPADE